MAYLLDDHSQIAHNVRDLWVDLAGSHVVDCVAQQIHQFDARNPLQDVDVTRRLSPWLDLDQGRQLAGIAPLDSTFAKGVGAPVVMKRAKARLQGRGFAGRAVFPNRLTGCQCRAPWAPGRLGSGRRLSSDSEG